jgi:hypothetical protein
MIWVQLHSCSFSSDFKGTGASRPFGIISAGLTIWQMRHMPRAPRFWGPRTSLFYFFSEFFVPCFSAGPKSSRKLEAPKNRPQMFSFCLSVLVFQRGAPNRKRYTTSRGGSMLIWQEGCRFRWGGGGGGGALVRYQRGWPGCCIYF